MKALKVVEAGSEAMRSGWSSAGTAARQPRRRCQPSPAFYASALPGKNASITAAFLWLLIFAIPSAFAADPASAKPERKTVVVLGDSLAAGYGVDPAESYPALLQQKMEAAKLPFTVVNAGVSGDTSAGGLRRIDWVLKRPMDVLVLELGGNDGLRGLTPEATRTNLQGIIDKARLKNAALRVVVAGMQMPANMGAEYTEKFRKVFSDLAQTNKAALIPFLLEGVGGREDLNQPDMIHPTAEGHKIVAENVWKVLQPVLEETAKSGP